MKLTDYRAGVRVMLAACGALVMAAVFLRIVPSMVPEAQADAARAEEGPAPWCAPGLVALSDRACFYEPASAKGAPTDARTLVIFMHNLVSAKPRGAWPQQKRMMLNAEEYGFSALIPRGRRGLGPGRIRSVLAWPTAPELQREVEPELLAELRSARATLAKSHSPWARVLMFGYSNGAYYASNLAFRDAVKVDGVAAFAGGSGSKYQRLLASRAKRRVPMFVGFGTKDPDHSRQEDMVRLLRVLGWPHRSLASRVGHTVSDAQIRGALRFLGHPSTARRQR